MSRLAVTSLSDSALQQGTKEEDREQDVLSEHLYSTDKERKGIKISEIASACLCYDYINRKNVKAIDRKLLKLANDS